MTELTQEPPRVETTTRIGASRAALAFIFATVLFDTLGFGIIIPVLPGLVVGFVGGDPARGAEIFGLFGTTWALMQFMFAPLLGHYPTGMVDDPSSSFPRSASESTT